MKATKFLGAASTALMIVILVTLVLAPGAWARSKFRTLHNFTGGTDGSQPHAGLIFDQAGNLYGTAVGGGTYGGGVVFMLAPNADGSWTESVLYRFSDESPDAGLIFDQVGNLYGTTSGDFHDCYYYDRFCGGVFELAPNSDGSWTMKELYRFNPFYGGFNPSAGVVFDAAGNLYGTTSYYGYGLVFKLAPNQDGSWTEMVLHQFAGGKDGASPVGGLIFDKAGSLYGTTSGGGSWNGTVFELTPNEDGSWTEKVLNVFTGKAGSKSQAGLIFDRAGNLYGTTRQGGGHSQACQDGCGVAFKLTPNADGSWTETVLHKFTGAKNGAYPLDSLIFDQAGNLYGTTLGGGAGGYGVVFKLAPNSNGGWNETVLHSFVDHPGANPYAGLIIDTAGNLYGTTAGDGTTTFGSVFEITP